MEKEEIKLSILCLVYNHEKYLRRCLEGFINQKSDYKFEVLIHDDASTDNSANIIKEYEEQYPDIIKPIYQKENQYSKGVDIQLTYQCPRAKGKYLAFCEGDDYWCDDSKIQKQIDFLEGHPEHSGVTHDTWIINDIGEKISLFWNREDEYDITMLNEYLDFPHTTSYMFLNPWKDEVSLNEKLGEAISSWDKSFAIYMIKRGKVHYFPQKMSCYRYVTEFGTSYQARMRSENLTYKIVGAELCHYRQLTAYQMQNVNISKHYYRNVIDYALGKYLSTFSTSDLQALKYGIQKCPYPIIGYCIYMINKIVKKSIRMPIKMIRIFLVRKK